MSPSGEKIVSRKQRWKKLLALETNSAHKHNQLVSQITEPISVWKVYFRSPPGEIYPRDMDLQSEENFFAARFFFLKLLENGEGNKGNDC